MPNARALETKSIGESEFSFRIQTFGAAWIYSWEEGVLQSRVIPGFREIRVKGVSKRVKLTVLDWKHLERLGLGKSGGASLSLAAGPDPPAGNTN
jgi:hypothetical protein